MTAYLALITTIIVATSPIWLVAVIALISLLSKPSS